MSETTKCATCGHDELNHCPFGENPGRRDLCDVPNCECRAFYAAAPAPTPPDAVREALMRVIQQVAGEAFENLALAVGVEPYTTISEGRDPNAEVATALLSRAPVGGTAEIVAYASAHAHRWLDKDDAYWFARLVQEVGELGSALAGDHGDPPEHELRQIGSIAMNWLRKRSAPVPPAQEGQRDNGGMTGRFLVVNRATGQVVTDVEDLNEAEDIREECEEDSPSHAYLIAETLRAAPSGVTEADIENLRHVGRSPACGPMRGGALLNLADRLTATLEARRVG